MSDPFPHHSIEQAAQSIVDLINSSPRSPPKAEIAALITGSDRRRAIGATKEHETWRKLVAEDEAAYHAATPENAAAEAAAEAAYERRCAFEVRIFEQRNPDLSLLGKIAFRCFWPGHDLDGPDSEALLAAEPHCINFDALAALLRATQAAEYREVTNAMDDLVVQEALSGVEGWERSINAPEPGITKNERERRIEEAHTRLNQIARKVWARTPVSVADIVARAIIWENWCAGVDPDTGELYYLDPKNVAAEHRPPECDIVAETHVLDAIRKVLGGRKYPLDRNPQ